MLEQLADSFTLITMQTSKNLVTLFILLAVLWSVFFVSLLEKRILLLGIIPRKIYGLSGILFAPLLHSNFNHLFFNSIPLVVLSNFILIHGLHYFILTTVLMTLSSGLLIWLFAKPGLHIGASAVITGFWALLVSDVYQQGTLTAILLGIVCIYYFAGIFLSVFPGKKGVSWEGHLFGLIAGFSIGYAYSVLKIPTLTVV